MSPERPEAKSVALQPVRSLRRWTYAFLGLIAVGMGFLGVFVPGLPTTVFLLVASYFFARSCPWLEQKMVRAPIFRPYLRYLDRRQGMPRGARIATIAVIWAASAASCLVLHLRGGLEMWFVVSMGLAALAGSAVVWRALRGSAAAGSAPPGTDPPT